MSYYRLIDGEWKLQQGSGVVFTWPNTVGKPIGSGFTADVYGVTDGRDGIVVRRERVFRSALDHRCQNLSVDKQRMLSMYAAISTWVDTESECYAIPFAYKISNVSRPRAIPTSVMNVINNNPNNKSFVTKLGKSPHVIEWIQPRGGMTFYEAAYGTRTHVAWDVNVFVKQLLDIVANARSHGLLLRDLFGENVLLDLSVVRPLQPLIIDFGLSHWRDDNEWARADFDRHADVIDYIIPTLSGVYRANREMPSALATPRFGRARDALSFADRIHLDKLLSCLKLDPKNKYTCNLSLLTMVWIVNEHAFDAIWTHITPMIPRAAILAIVDDIITRTAH